MPGPKPQRVVYKEILPGDIRKIREESNDTDSGGGARDLRFNHPAFEDIFGKMFTGRREQERRRSGEMRTITIYEGDLAYEPSQTTEIHYEPPTDSRPSEARIPRISQLPPFENIPEPPDDRVFVLIVQDAAGKIRIHFAAESSLRTKGKWNVEVAQPILNCHGDTPDHQAAQGYIDLTDGTTYCHGS